MCGFFEAFLGWEVNGGAWRIGDRIMTTNGPLRDGQKTITGQLANVLTSVHLRWWFVVIYCLIHCKGKTIYNIIPKNGPRIVYFPALIYGNMSFFPIFFILFFFFAAIMRSYDICLYDIENLNKSLNGRKCHLVLMNT